MGGFAEDAIDLNWNFELWTWKRVASKRFLNLRNRFCNSGWFKVFYFDPHREFVTIRIRPSQGRLKNNVPDVQQTVTVEDEEDWFIDMIGLDVMRDPVRTTNGRHYERQSIMEWGSTRTPRSPYERNFTCRRYTRSFTRVRCKASTVQKTTQYWLDKE